MKAICQAYGHGLTHKATADTTIGRRKLALPSVALAPGCPFILLFISVHIFVAMTDTPDPAAVLSPAVKAAVLIEALPYIRRFTARPSW